VSGKVPPTRRSREIEEETEREAVDKAISDKPIRLRIVSPHVLTMTVSAREVPTGTGGSLVKQSV